MADEPPTVPETDDDLTGAPPLTPRELAFCRFYGDPQSVSYGRATKSAVLAGYAEKSAWTTGWKLRHRPSIRAKLAEYDAAVQVAVGRVLADLENERIAAMEKGDIASAVRATELQGKHLAMFKENVEITLPMARAYTEQEAFEAKRLASMMLEGKPGELPAVEAEPLALPVNQEQAIGE